MFIYQFVASNNGQLKSMVFENKKLIPFEAIGENKGGRYTREELIGQPIFNNWLGPMYNGQKGNRTIIRYESSKAYDLLSK